MKREWRKLCAGILSVIMFITFIMPVNAEIADTPLNQNETVQLSNNNVEFEGQNVIGNLFASELQEKESQQQDNKGYNIFSIDVEGSVAKVSFETQKEAKLIVGIYSEDGREMFASGIAEISAEEKTAQINLPEEKIPQYYLIRGYMVDIENISPLCQEYQSSEHTKEMQDFLSKTTDDFKESLVLNLDENKDNNFAVYKESVLMIENQDGQNHLSEESTDKYVFTNPDDVLSRIKEGDIFRYRKDDGEELAVKVKSVKKLGDTVTITADDTQMQEVFDYVRIDVENGLQDAAIDTSMCKDGLIYNGLIEKEEAAPYALDIEHHRSKALSYDFKDYEGTAEGSIGSAEAELSVRINGSLQLALDNSVKIYLSGEQQYVEWVLETTLQLQLSIEGSANLKIPFAKIGLDIAFVQATISPCLLIEAAAKVELAGRLTSTTGFSVSLQEGIKNLSTNPEFDSEINVEGTYFVGLSLEPKLSTMDGKMLSVEIGARIGAELKVENQKEEHECEHCLAGEINGKAEIEMSASFGSSEKLKFEKKFEWTLHLLDFYYSYTFDEMGWGKCPHLEGSYKVAQIEAGSGNSAVITESGTLYIWGNNYYGVIGDGTTEDKSSPVRVMYGVKKVVLGERNTAVITKKGDLYVWGNNQDGQIGDGTTENRYEPVKIMSGITDVSMGRSHCIALTESGDVYTWGNNQYGQIGNGTQEAVTEPVRVLSGVKKVAAGTNNSAAINQDGSFYAWGDNSAYQMANRDGGCQLTPVCIMNEAEDVSCGTDYFLVLKTNHDVYGWGRNDNSELLEGSEIQQYVQGEDGWAGWNYYQCTPKLIFQKARALDAGAFHSAVITEEGTAYLWGNNYDGEIGYEGNTGQRIIGDAKEVKKNVKSVALGSTHSLLLTEDEKLYACGANYDGELGLTGNDRVMEFKEVSLWPEKQSVKEQSAKIYMSSTDAEDTGRTTGYKNLKKGKSYIFYVNAEDTDELKEDILLYMTQGKADESGNWDIEYCLPEGTEQFFEKLSGAGTVYEGENVLPGDIDGNGKVNLQDSALLRRYLAGWDVTIDKNAADVDGNGKVNLQDSALLRRYLAGWDVTLK